MMLEEKNDVNLKRGRTLPPALDSYCRKFIVRNDFTQIEPMDDSPTVVLFPQVFRSNVARIRSILTKNISKHKVYFAHKATKQNIFPKVAKSCGIQIDVASTEELMSAFQAGFQGHEIEATGPKSDSFLEILVLHECLISIDSIQELTRLSNIIEKIQPSKKINIGLRLGKVTLPSRDLKYVLSRFGITDVDFHSALEIIKNNSSLNLKAIHFHSGRLSFGEKVSLLPAICSLVKVALSEGFLIEELNLGGGFRNDLLENNTDWDQYLDSIEEQLLNGEGVNSWSGSNYGLQLNQTGTISGRGIALSKGEPENYESSLNSLLSKKIDEYYTLAAFLDELDITLAIEPGYFLLDQAGMSFFKVIEAKESLSGHNFVVVGGNYYDLASHVREYIPDPIHLPRNKISGAPFTAYISGNLCREDDVLINRAIIFQRKPEPGDLLCFTNTAAYKSDFENISAHMRKPTADFEAAWLSPTGIWNLRTANKLSHLEIKNILIN